jgi:hypothetical protein
VVRDGGNGQLRRDAAPARQGTHQYRVAIEHEDPAGDRILQPQPAPLHVDEGGDVSAGDHASSIPGCLLHTSGAAGATATRRVLVADHGNRSGSRPGAAAAPRRPPSASTTTAR